MIYAAIASGSFASYATSLGVCEYPWLLMAHNHDADLAGLNAIPYNPEGYMTDSGAYSAWTLGEEVDLAAYIEWCRTIRASKRAACFDHINLDVIPGERGKTPTPAQKKRAVQEGLRNADEIRAAGLPVMEVFHQGEPIKILHQLLDRRQEGEVVGISPRQGISPQLRRQFCDYVFAEVLGRHPRAALPPLHGLGVAGRGLTFRYPWRSTDTSAWVAPSKFGRVLDRAGRTIHEPRTARAPMREHHILQGLRVTMKWASALTRLWEQRGVVHAA